jgi:hypothetical protein
MVSPHLSVLACALPAPRAAELPTMRAKITAVQAALPGDLFRDLLGEEVGSSCEPESYLAGRHLNMRHSYRYRAQTLVAEAARILSVALSAGL